MWNQDDEDVPVMDDFNRERRFFTIGETLEFMNTSLDNYYNMFNSSDEFEDYSSGDYENGDVIPASMFVIAINGQDQKDKSYPLNCEKEYLYPTNGTEEQSGSCAKYNYSAIF